MSLFVFDMQAALQVTMICAAVLFLLIVVGIMCFFLVDLVERDCRREFDFDREGRRDDSKGD